MLAHFCDWLAATPLSQQFQVLTWFVPLVQTVHILSVAIVMTSVGVLDFKLLGIADRAQGLAPMVARTMPPVWRALCVLFTTGALLTITEPSRELLNIGFRVKMLMVALLAGLLSLIERRLRADGDYWQRTTGRRAAARAIGALSLLLAVSIVAAGRWIAYLV